MYDLTKLTLQKIMATSPQTTAIYHITDVTNLQSIIASTGISSDARMIASNAAPTAIGYAHIKHRRLTEYRIPCCNNRFVGEFVPFYFCPRSPMLCIINNGKTDRPIGCQSSIVHLVSDAGRGIALGGDWAISDGNAGAAYTDFSNAPEELNNLDWEIIRSNSWGGERLHKKQSEFLVADFFPWESITKIGCHSEATANEVFRIIQTANHKPIVAVEPFWYYN